MLHLAAAVKKHGKRNLHWMNSEYVAFKLDLNFGIKIVVYNFLFQ